jgi:CBS domain-containing protein
MRARDVMSRPVVSVDTATTVREAITILTEHGFAAVPVIDDMGHVVGIFSESDALRADTTATGREQPVTAAMVTPVEVVAPTADVATIAERMLIRRLRCVPVVAEGILIGVVSRRDLLRILVRDDDVIKGNLRRVLDDYAGSRRRWAVTVTHGVVTVSGNFADPAEKAVVAALARTVGGVSTVEIVEEASVPVGWDD